MPCSFGIREFADAGNNPRLSLYSSFDCLSRIPEKIAKIFTNYQESS